MSRRTIQQVQQEYTDAWMALPGVVGTAIGTCHDRPAILVLTTSENEITRARIPSTAEGYPIVIRHTDNIRALDTP